MSGSLMLNPVRRSRPQGAAHPAAVVSPALAGAFAVAFVSFAVYLATLAPDLYSLDSPELAAAAYRLGIAHPPGYPLYTLLGWLFSHTFLVSTVAFRLNLLSAVFAVAAVVATYGLAQRLTARPVVAMAASLSLAFSYWFWADSLAAEAYTLDAALFAGMLWASYAWRAQPGPGRAAAVGLLFGLGCATRTTTLFYLPALVAFAWVSGERSPRAYGAAAGAVCAALLLYAYLPLRSAFGVSVGPGSYSTDGVLHVWDLATVGGFWRHVSASAFHSDAFAFGPVGFLRESGTFLVMLAGSFLGIGVVFGAAGIVRQWATDRALLLLLAGTALPVTLFFIDYGTLDKEFMFLPAYVVWAVWMAVGMSWAIDVLAPGAGAFSLAGAAMLMLPAIALGVNARLVSLHGEHRIRNESESFLAQVEQGAIVYGPFLDVAPFQYLQQVEGARDDVRLVNAWTVDEEFLASLAEANVGQRAFYVTQDFPALRRLYRLTPMKSGKGFEVRPRGGAP